MEFTNEELELILVGLNLLEEHCHTKEQRRLVRTITIKVEKEQQEVALKYKGSIASIVERIYENK